MIAEFKLDVSLHGSDCAVILPLLKLFNYDLEKLNKVLVGEYSFAIVEYHQHKLKQLFLSTDPLSVRPMFIGFSQDLKSFGFSSLLSGLAPFFQNVERFGQKQF